jgi:DNA polymerase-3 subunit beta
MQVTLPRATLVADLRLAERVLPARSPEPLLDHVLIRAEPPGCTLLATDREVALWLQLEAEVARPGTVLLPARQALAFLRESAAESLRLEQDGDAVRLSAAGATCRLLASDPARFPAPGPFPARAHALLPAEPLYRAVRRTTFAAARGPGYYRDYFLEAALLEVGATELRLVTSDNRRLAVAEVPFLSRVGSGLPPRLLMAVRALELLGRLADEQEEAVRACFGPDQAFFRVGRATVAARLLRGRFPDWRAALPRDTRLVVELPAGAMLTAVRLAAVLRERVHARLQLRLEPGRLTLESRQTGTGSVTVEQAVDYDGAAVDVAFNPAYLLELLRALEEGDKVRLELSVTDWAALFVIEGVYRHVLMPLRPAGPDSTPPPDPVFSHTPPLAIPLPPGAQARGSLPT